MSRISRELLSLGLRIGRTNRGGIQRLVHTSSVHAGSTSNTLSAPNSSLLKKTSLPRLTKQEEEVIFGESQSIQDNDATRAIPPGRSNNLKFTIQPQRQLLTSDLELDDGWYTKYKQRSRKIDLLFVFDCFNF